MTPRTSEPVNTSTCCAGEPGQAGLGASWIRRASHPEGFISALGRLAENAMQMVVAEASEGRCAQRGGVPKTLVMSAARSCAAFWMGAGSCGSISKVVCESIVVCPRAAGSNRRMIRIRAVLLLLIIVDMDILRKRQWGQPLRFFDL